MFYESELLTEHHLELLSFKGGCTSSSESTSVKMPHCWKSHVAAHILFYPGKATTLIMLTDSAEMDRHMDDHNDLAASFLILERERTKPSIYFIITKHLKH